MNMLFFVLAYIESWYDINNVIQRIADDVVAVNMINPPYDVPTSRPPTN